MKLNSRTPPGLVLVLAVWLGSAGAARATTWLLANGDRLTGESITETAQDITIQHPQLGVIKVPRAALLPAKVSRQTVGDGTEAKTPSSQTATQSPVKTAEAPKWKRQIEVGYVQQSGAKDKQDLAVRGEVNGQEGANTFRAIGRVMRSENDGQIVNDRREGDFRWRRDLNKRMFAQALTTYEEDGVRNIDLNLEQQIGGGYRLIDGERHKASVGLGAVVQYLQRKTIDERTALLGSFFQDYSYQLNNRLKLVQESSFMLSDQGTLNSKSTLTSVPTEGNYRLKFNTGVQSKVTEHMALNVRFELDYDRSVLEANLRTDQRLTTSLGYLW